jgi:hypothetical protein
MLKTWRDLAIEGISGAFGKKKLTVDKQIKASQKLLGFPPN